VAEIAYSVGYANSSYFNKLFKEEYGCSPREFRKLTSRLATSADHQDA
jgi:AraC-like DNA-binding protein